MLHVTMVEGLEAGKLTVDNLSLTLGAQWTRLFALFHSTAVVVGCMFASGRSKVVDIFGGS